LPEYLGLSAAECATTKLVRVTIDPAVLPEWNNILTTYRPSMSIAPFTTAVPGGNELTFSAPQVWSASRPGWLPSTCAGVPSVETDEGWRYHLFAYLAALDAGFDAVYVAELAIRNGSAIYGTGGITADRVTALFDALRAYELALRGRTLVVGSESLEDLAPALASRLDFVKEVMDVDVAQSGGAWPYVFDSDGSPYACFAPGNLEAVATSGGDPNSLNCADGAFRTGPLCIADSDRTMIRPYATTGSGSWAIVNANARTHQEVPIPVLLELDGFQGCSYWNYARYSAVDPGPLAVYYEANQCSAWDQTTCVSTVRNGLSNTMRFLSQPASRRRAFITYAAQAAALWSRESGVPAYFPQLVRVDQNLAVVAQSIPTLPAPTSQDLAQPQLLRYCPDDLGVATASSLSYQYVAAECGDLDAVAGAFSAAGAALGTAAQGYAHHLYATLEQRSASAPEVSALATPIASAADTEAAAVAAARALATNAGGPLPALTEDEFTGRLFLAVVGRAPAAAELTGLAALARPARVDAVLALYEARRQLKRLGLRTAPLNQGRFVMPLYVSLLGRQVPAVDETETAYWSNELFQGRQTSTTVVHAFIGSPEFSAYWSAKCASDPVSCNWIYVTGLYHSLLHREPDTSGWQFWSTQLDSAALTRLQVADAFLGSPEFSGRMTTLGL
jgi:hypothetical protein